jgi:hypothetical protein
MSAEFNPATGKLGNVEPLARPERNGRHHKNGNGHKDLPLDKPPQLQVVTADGEAVAVGEDIDPRELAMRLASELEHERRLRKDAENALHDIQREQIQYRAKVRRLENDKQKERMEYVKRAEVEKAFDHWRTLVAIGKSSRKQCKLSDERFDAIRKALETGYTVRTLDHASLYISRFPFTTNRPGERAPHGREADRWDDIELICRKGNKLEKWAQMGAGIVRSEGYVFPWDRAEGADA